MSALEVDLTGCRAIVTGAAMRMGRALALALGEAGADVGVHCLASRVEAAAVVDELSRMGRNATLVQTDLTDPAATQAAFATAAEVLGGLDILVNNVGTIVWKRIDEHSADDWRRCLDGTLFVSLNASEAALPFLRRSGRGRIINILDADADATDPVPFATAYKIGKRATFTLTKTLARTEAPNGVTVNAVSPGTLEDSATKPALEQIPAGRYGRYEDVSSAVLFLASEAAGYLTGAQLKVSGGYLI